MSLVFLWIGFRLGLVWVLVGVLVICVCCGFGC